MTFMCRCSLEKVLCAMVLGIITAPYVALPLLLGRGGTKEIISSLHPVLADTCENLGNWPVLESIVPFLLIRPEFS